MKIVIDGKTAEIPSGGSSGGVPVGSIIIWSGAAADIPSGWALCDGQDGRPDLRDKFVLGGGGTHTVGSTGGEETHTLTVEEMPEHSHILPKRADVSSDPLGSAPTYDTFNHHDPGTLNNQPQTNSSGNSQPHNNMPPYYTLCYIIKVSGGAESGGSSGDAYTAEETRIGTWIDGKPIYRRIINVTKPSTYKNPPTTDWVDSGIVLDTVALLINSRILQTSTDGYMCAGATANGSAGLAIRNYHLLLASFYWASCANIPVTVIIEYTKTTD